jgi:DNA-binding HxlR family transcriptional regulator
LGKKRMIPHTASSDCAVERTLTVLRDDWSLLILRDLLEKPMRFNELKKSLDGVTAKTLSDRLQSLEKAAVVTRKIYPEVPVKVVYSLTEKGQALNKVIDDIRSWGEKWMPVDLVLAEAPKAK